MKIPEKLPGVTAVTYCAWRFHGRLDQPRRRFVVGRCDGCGGDGRFHRVRMAKISGWPVNSGLALVGGHGRHRLNHRLIQRRTDIVIHGRKNGSSCSWPRIFARTNHLGHPANPNLDGSGTSRWPGAGTGAKRQILEIRRQKNVRPPDFNSLPGPTVLPTTLMLAPTGPGAGLW